MIRKLVINMIMPKDYVGCPVQIINKENKQPIAMSTVAEFDSATYKLTLNSRSMPDLPESELIVDIILPTCKHRFNAVFRRVLTLDKIQLALYNSHVFQQRSSPRYKINAPAVAYVSSLAPIKIQITIKDISEGGFLISAPNHTFKTGDKIIISVEFYSNKKELVKCIIRHSKPNDEGKTNYGCQIVNY